MKAVISSTYDDLYFFFLPIVTWSWNKLGVDVIVFLPFDGARNNVSKAFLVGNTMASQNLSFELHTFSSPDHKAATYSQCARLYAAALGHLPADEVLITGDVDMAVFNKDYFNQANNGLINVFGADLVPSGQYPICYVAMPVDTWREVMWLWPGESPQTYLDNLLGELECEHFKGNYWAKDQETIYNALTAQAWPVIKHFRAKAPHAFATYRADRDGWPDAPMPGIIDAHLPRPGYTDENFRKILKLFKDVYPEEDFSWMVEYQQKYLKLTQ